jgi:hypothetical protein
VTRRGIRAAPASRHTERTSSNADATSSAIARGGEPITPSAHAVARRSDFGPNAPDQIGGPRLHRRRPDRLGARERRLAAPEPAQLRDLRVEPAEPVLERLLGRAVVVLAAADADRDRDAPVREHVEARHLLRDQRGRVHRQDVERRHDPHALGQRGGAPRAACASRCCGR